MRGFDKLLEHYSKGLEKKLDAVLEEGLGDTIKRKAKRFKQQASRKFWWDGHVSPQEMQAKVKASSDEDLNKFRSQLDTAGPNKQNAHMAKLIDRELKSRYGVSPQGNMKEDDAVGAGGRQATMKTKPEGYLKGQKFVGG